MGLLLQVQYKANKHKKHRPAWPGGWNYQLLSSKNKLKNPDQLLWHRTSLDEPDTIYFLISSIKEQSLLLTKEMNLK